VVAGVASYIEASLTGSAACAATNLRIQATANLNGFSSFDISSLVPFDISLSGSSVVTSSLKLDAQAISSLSGSASLSAGIEVAKNLGAELLGYATKTASVLLKVAGVWSVSGASSTGAAGPKLTVRPTATLNAGAFLAPNPYEPSVLGEGSVGEIWLGSGEEVPPEITNRKLSTASIASMATVLFECEADYRLDATVLASASLSAEAYLFDEYPPITFSGQATLTGSTRLDQTAQSAVSGSAALLASLYRTHSVISQMTASASLSAELSFQTPVEASLAASSTSQLANLEDLIVASILSSSMVVADLIKIHSLETSITAYGWIAALPEVVNRGTFPGSPPAVNAAVVLEQFIDALGLSKKPTKTIPANHLTIVVNPRRRRQEDR
jgi:hypothetical protein